MKRLTPIKGIRAKCLDCSGGSANEVRLCPVTDCALYPFRLGHNPNIKRGSRGRSPEQMAEIRKLVKSS